MGKNERATARNSIMLWSYISGSIQAFCDDIRFRLDANHNLDPNFYQFFNAKYQQKLVALGYKRHIFKDNNTLLASIRRTYRQLETSKNAIDKNVAAMLRYAYENPAFNVVYTVWTLLLTSKYTPCFDNEKILLARSGKTDYAEIGYYIFMHDAELNKIFNDDVYLKELYKMCCDCIESLFEYYNVSKSCKYSDSTYSMLSDNPLEISILLAFDVELSDLYYFYINFHKFRDFKAFKNQFIKLANWINKTRKNKKIDKNGDASNPESPDFDEFILKWVRPVSKMYSSFKFDVRASEIGLRNSNYIKYE